MSEDNQRKRSGQEGHPPSGDDSLPSLPIGWFARMVQQAADGILVVNHQGTIQFANEAAARLFGREQKSLVGEQLGHPISAEEPVEIAIVGREDGIRHAELKASATEWEGKAYHIVNLRDITRRRLLEQQLRHREQVLAQTGRAAQVGGWELQLENEKLSWTEETARIHALPPDSELSLKEAFQFYHPEDQRRVMQAVKRAREEGKGYNLVLRFTDARGNKRWVRAIGRSEMRHGRCIRLWGSFQDITTQHEAQIELRASEERYRSLFSSIRDAILVANTDREIIHTNQALLDLFGYSSEELLGKPTLTLYENEEEFERLGETIRKSRPDEELLVTINYRRKDGSCFPGETKVFYLYAADGKVAGFIGLIRDVTRRQQELATIRFQSELLAAVQQSIVVTDVDGIISYWNESSSKLFGLDASEAVGQHLLSIIPIADVEKTTEGMMPKLLSGESWSGRMTMQRQDGSWFTGLVHNSPLMDVEGRFSGIVGITTDISKELQLVSELHKLSSAIEQSPAAVIITDLEGKVEFINPSYTRLSGYTLAELQGELCPIFHAEEIDLEEVREQLHSGSVWRGEYTGQRVDGTEYRALAVISPMRDAKDEISQYVVTKLDISSEHRLREEKTHLENELSRQFHLTQVGLLASGITHNIRSPLTAAKMNTDMLRQKIEKALTETSQDPLRYYETLEESERSLLMMQRSLERIEQVVNDLSEYHRMNLRKDSVVDLNKTLTSDVEMLRADLDIKHKIELSLQLRPGKLLVRASANTIGQIFLNLASNARDAMLQMPERRMVVRSGLSEDGSTAWFEVADSGPGVPEEVRKRIGQPFNSTKSDDPEAVKRGSGTGLGLYMVNRLVKQSDGRMEIESTPGDTRFRIYLPCAREEQAKEVAHIVEAPRG